MNRCYVFLKIFRFSKFTFAVLTSIANTFVFYFCVFSQISWFSVFFPTFVADVNPTLIQLFLDIRLFFLGRPTYIFPILLIS